MKVENREKRKNSQSNDLLNRLELNRRELVRTDSICRHLKAIFREGDDPADDNNFKKRGLAIFQVSIPGKGHKNIRERQQKNGSHAAILPDQAPPLHAAIAIDRKVEIVEAGRYQKV